MSKEEEMPFVCQFCSFRSSTWRQYLRHTFEAHSRETNFCFTCGVEGCSQTFTKYSAILSHLSRKHRGVNFEQAYVTPTLYEDGEQGHNGDTDTQAEMPMAVEPTSSSNGDTHSLDRSAALFLLTLKEQHQVTQKVVDFAVEEVRQMVSYAVDHVHKSVTMKLSECSQAIGCQVPDISDCFKVPDPFGHLESEYMQTKFYRDNFDLVVGYILKLFVLKVICASKLLLQEPVTIVLGSEMRNDPRGTLREHKDTFQYVPLERGLRALLKNQSIRDEVSTKVSMLSKRFIVPGTCFSYTVWPLL